MTAQTASIAPQILLVSAFLSFTWGSYLLYTISDYVNVRRDSERRQGDRVKALRRLVVAFCLWMICFSYVFRTAMVIVGFANDEAGQITFFALLGTNVAGSLFALVTLKYD